MNTYTVIGLYVDDEPVVAGVVAGEHACVDRDAGPYQRWADPIEAPDAATAERTALAARSGDEPHGGDPGTDHLFAESSDGEAGPASVSRTIASSNPAHDVLLAHCAACRRTLGEYADTARHRHRR